MNRLKGGVAAVSLAAMLVYATAAQAAITTSNITTPADGSLMVQNLATNPSGQTFTVSGTTNGNAGDLFDIACYAGNTRWEAYAGPSSAGIALTSTDGSFSVTGVPESLFAGGPNSGECHLVAVPHGTSPSPGASYTGPRVGFSEFSTSTIPSGANAGAAWDYYFNDAAMLGSDQSESIDSCGPFPLLTDGTSAVNLGPYMFDCAGSFYNSPGEFHSLTSPDLTRAEIQVDGQNAYGSASAKLLFGGSDALPGFPALSASLDSFSTSTGDAQTTESEPLVKCTPNDVYGPTSSDCTAFGSTGVSIKRVTAYTNSGRVATVTDTYSSTDGAAHSIDVLYEDDLGANTAGWKFPGQVSFVPSGSGSGPSAWSPPATVYAIENTGAAPSLSNPVGALTYASAYGTASFDSTLWSAYAEPSGLFDYQDVVPAGGSVSIAWSYAVGTSLAEVQGDASAALDVLQPPGVSISSPAAGATLLTQPVKVAGTASAGSGVKSVSVNGVAATVSGGNWVASVPLAKGTNMLTATMTSNGGASTTASETVAYVPPAVLIRKSERFNGRAVLVKVSCWAAGSDCKGTVRLHFSELVIRHRRHRRISVGSVTKDQTVLAAHAGTIAVALGGRQRRALKSAGRLKVTGLVMATQASGVQATAPHASFTLTIKQRAKKRHK